MEELFTSQILICRAAASFNNPINANDPSGQDANVTVNGNKVSIEIPINYAGNAANPATIQQLNNAIQNQWSGTFGQYQVTTKVTQPGWFDSANNIQLTKGTGISQVVNGNSGTWYQPGQKNPSWEASHEAGHLLGLSDHYTQSVVNGARVTQPQPGFQTNIMGDYGQTGVTARDITTVINSNTPWYTKAWDSITSFFSPSAANSSAAGGFLLYPNKPNNNGSVSVYAK